jgi:hypothetical protein
VRQYDDRYRGQTHVAGSLQAGVSGDDGVVGADQDRIDESELSDAGGQLLDLQGGMRPGVLGVGDEPSNRALLDMPNSERGTTLRGPYGECGPAPGLARGSWKGTPIRIACARRRLVRGRFRIAWFQILMHTSFHETLLYCNSTLPRATAFWIAAVPGARAASGEGDGGRCCCR